MAGANVPDIAADPELAILKVQPASLLLSGGYVLFSFCLNFGNCRAFSHFYFEENTSVSLLLLSSVTAQGGRIALQLLEKFRFELDEEAAVHYFQGLITESVSALFPQVVETIHRWAQYWR